MNELKDNIKLICDPVINNYITSLKALADYAIVILVNLYDKKFCKKHIYKEYIQQLICEQYKTKFSKKYNYFYVHNNSHIVEYLQKIPQYEQRTPEWFKIRETSIGASESAIIFGKSIFSNKNKLLLKKSGYKVEFIQNPACLHGTKYEPVVQLLYQKKNDTILYEFGSIVHDKYSMVSASPDGITKEGVMIEIKVPFRRVITGIPPIYYWYQMQQQLEVCNLDRVDFVECNISEYLNKKEFLSDYEDSENDFYNRKGDIRNVIIEYFKKNAKNELELDWVYPKNFLKIDEIDNWLSETKTKLGESDDSIFSKEIYYKINKYSCSQVWRDRDWWINNYKKYLDFWKEVEYYKKVGYESLLPKKRVRKKRAVKCLIDDDEY